MSNKAVSAALIALSMICLAQASFATEKRINLLPEGVKADGILVRESVVKMSNTLKSMLEDLGPITDKMDVPVYHVDERTLKAILYCLEEMQKLQERGVLYRFHPLKLLVTHSFPLTSLATSSDYINFLLVANFLNIPALLRPAAANVVDAIMAEEPEVKPVGRFEFWYLWNLIFPEEETPFEARFKQLIKKHQIPNELLPYFIDYKNWKANPTSLITQIKKILVQSDPEAFVVTENKLYVANTESDNISVIDRRTGLSVHAPIRVGLKPKALGVFHDKLYVANSGSDNISVIDLKTDQLSGEPIAVGRGPSALSFFDDKLFVVNELSNDVFVIDPKTDRVSGAPIAVGNGPKALCFFGNKLYVANMGSNNISVIDLRTAQKLGAPIRVGLGPRALSVFDNKLYAVNFGSDNLSVIDLKTDQLSDAPIAVGLWPVALSAFGNKLFVANFKSNNIFVVDLKTNEAIGSPIALSSAPIALSIFDNKLYVGNKDKTVLVFDLNKFLYYSK